MRLLPVLVGTALLALVGVQTGAFERVQAAAQNSQADATCPVSVPVLDRPPDDPAGVFFSTASGIWYANEARTVWAWWWGQRSFGDYKVMWVRPRGARLTITARRLDGETAAPSPLELDTNDWTFHTSAVALPTADSPIPGCWQITGAAGTERLTFVVRTP